MTSYDLDAMEAAVKAAAKGPWVQDSAGGQTHHVYQDWPARHVLGDDWDFDTVALAADPANATHIALHHPDAAAALHRVVRAAMALHDGLMAADLTKVDGPMQDFLMDWRVYLSTALAPFRKEGE